MGIERWGDEEHYDANSANANRAIIERRLEEQRRFQESLRYEEDRKMEQRDKLNAEREARAMAKPFSASFERGLRGQIMQDEWGREAYKEGEFFSSVAKIVVGTALMVSSVASESLHNKALYDAQEDAARSFYSQSEQVKSSLDDNRTTTLAMYERRVSDAKEELMATQNAYYEEHKQIKEAARAEMDDARRTYREEQKGFESESKSADKALRRECSKIDKQEDAARAAFEAEKREIETKFAGDKDKMAEELRKATAGYDKTIQSLESQRSAAQDQHQSRIADITRRSEESEQRRNEIVSSAKQTIAESQHKFDSAVSNSERVLNNAQTRLDAFQASNAKLATETGAQSIAEGYSGRHNVVSSNVMSGRNASKFAEDVMSKHKTLGQDIAFSIGSTEEKQILQRVQDQRAANLEAKANGMIAPKIASDEDIKQASQIIKKYAGDITSEKGVSRTIFQLEEASKIIGKDIDALKAIRDTKQGTLADVSGKMSQLTKDLTEIASIQKMLSLGKGEGGKPLTAEQRAALTGKLGQLGNVDVLKASLAALGKERSLLEKDIKNGSKMISQKENVLGGISSHLKLLEKHGKTIAGTMVGKGGMFGMFSVFGSASLEQKTRLILDGNARKAAREKGLVRGKSAKAQKMQKKGSGMVFQSIGKLSRNLSREIHKGNDIHQGITKMAMGASRFAQRYEMALNIGKMATKFMMMPMGLFVKIGKQSIHIFGTKTRLGQNLAARIALFKSKHAVGLARIGKVGTVLGTSGKVIGGKLLRAPISILRTPMNIMRLPQTLGKKVVDLGFRTTRKGISLLAGGGGKLAGKGLRKLNSVTFGKWKWSRAIGNGFKRVFSVIGSPFKFLQRWKKIIGAAIRKFFSWLFSGLIGGLTTLAGYIMTLLGYVLYAIAIIAAVIVAVALLLCVMALITNWWKKNLTENKALVQNDPSVIMNQAVNYRNFELEMLEMFKKQDADEYTIPVSSSPIHYALAGYTNYSYGGVSGLALNATNNGAKNYFHDLKNIVGDSFVSYENYTIEPFNAGVTHYESAKVRYYSADQLETDSNGNYKMTTRGGYSQPILKAGVVASDYEISNAKDALSMVDAIYSGKSSKMQKGEVLAYLGVGQYQMADKNNNTAYNNLFWATHHIMYKKGNDVGDIWYHYNKEVVDEAGTTHTYTIDETSKYSNVIHGAYSKAKLGKTIHCVPEGQRKAVSASYTVPETTYIHTSDINTYTSDHSGHGEFYASASAVSTTETNQTLTGTAAFYYSKASDYNWNFRPDSDYAPEYDRVYYNCDFGTTTGKVYVAQIKDVTDSNIMSLYKGSSCEKLNFFRSGKNEYHVVDLYGYYMGKISIGTNSNLYKSITTATGKKDGKNYNFNVNLINTNEINLKYFFLTYDESDGCYKFMHMSHQLIKTPTSALNSSVASGQSLSQVDKVKEAKSIRCASPSLKTDKIKVDSCSHTKTEDVAHQIIFEVCPGHIDLEVDIAVSGIENDTIFKDAQNVQGLDEDKEVGTFLGICYSSGDDIWGLGGYTQYAYKPKEDWSKNGNINLAKAKYKTEYEYKLDENHTVSDYRTELTHFGNKFMSVTENDGKLLYGMMFGNTRYYTNSFISGKQENLSVYKADEKGKITGSKTISLKVKNGVPKLE